MKWRLHKMVNKVPAKIGKRSIDSFSTRDLLVPIKVVEAIGRLEVASRIQQRTNAIMRYAVQSGLSDYNPAQEMAGAVASSNRVYRPALDLKRLPELLHRIVFAPTKTGIFNCPY
ncbi:integrase [Xenorhabdus ishibashii]|uniref:Integrase n=1 Tax=Xenorhabdus ishibashii TaxID=1034471 RepID=A0A2D0KHT0_9GAMM|nr:integrase [Xenorhabdus ishibashii]